VYARDTLEFASPSDRETLEQQVRYLQERLAFYEAFDLLIQDNVANARELFRLAAQEREAAGAASQRHQQETRAGQRDTQLRRELEAVAHELESLTEVVAALSRRVALALDASDSAAQNGWQALPVAPTAWRVAVVAHGVPSARTALSLQRFVASLPQVSEVSAREYSGGILRLDARVQEPLQADQFRTWADAPRIDVLTEDPDVIEFTLQTQSREAVAALVQL
jgi:hypothetical protein